MTESQPADLASARLNAQRVGIPSARRHIFLCCDQTKPKCCDRARSLVAWDYLKTRLGELGLSDDGGVLRTRANCLRVCKAGPVAVVYPKAPGTPTATRPCWSGSSRST